MNDAESAAHIVGELIYAADDLANAVKRYGLGEITKIELGVQWAMYSAMRDASRGKTREDTKGK